MGMEVAHPEDLQRKLHGTVCLYDGIPVYVTMVQTGQLDIRLEVLDNSLKSKLKVKKTVPSDDKLEVYDIPLGYCSNNSGEYFYLTRSTRRSYNQGLLAHNIKRIQGYVFSVDENLSKCILGDHVSCQEAFQLVKDGESPKMAFHRHFAFSSDGTEVYLLYRDKQIAYTDGEMVTFRLFNNDSTSIVLRELTKHGYADLLG